MASTTVTSRSKRLDDPRTMVVEAARRMLSDDVGSLPVVDGNRVVGMITDRDLVLQVVAKDLDPHKIPSRTSARRDPRPPSLTSLSTTRSSAWPRSRFDACRSSPTASSWGSSPRRTSPARRAPSRPVGSSRRSS